VAIEKLLKFGLKHGLIEEYDIVLVRNQLYEYLKMTAGDIQEWQGEPPETATEILAEISAAQIPNATQGERDLFEAAIMGILMPRQSEIIRRFRSLPVSEATSDFYALSRAANYIQADRIKKDIYWTAETEYGTIELTINLSKPEKDPKDIAAASAQPATTYPKCLLCLENIGFAGNAAWPARQNLRAIPITLNGGNWYFQYSPYSYYNEHSIIFGERHTPMEINETTFRQLVDFVKQFPHYFIGSNAGLPIVGGSILSHEHFQGGRHEFPMERAKSFNSYRHGGYPGVAIDLIKWPLSVVRLSTPTENAEEIIKLAALFLEKWRDYSEGDIIAHTNGTPHNAITPITRIKNGMLEFDLALRNNRTSDEHPFGIFHPHEQWHHVKKENIGLIEVMGLAILPGRLKTELEEGRLSRAEIGEIFVNVLKDCGVFKDNHERFDRFIKSVKES